MKTIFDIVDSVYEVLSNSTDIAAVITGKIAKHQRLLNSKKIDIVIGSLPVNNEAVQETVVNVNIHVPNLQIGTGTAQDNTQPDTVRLNSISKLCIDVLDGAYIEEGDYDFTVQQQWLFSEGNEHYSNIRLAFTSINEQYFKA